MSLLKCSDIDMKHIQYTKPEKNGAYYYATMSYGNSQPIHLQSPRFRCRYTGDEFIEKGHGTMQFEPINNDYDFYNFLLQLDDRNIKHTYHKNKEWFGKNIPLTQIEDMYKRSSKPMKQGEKPQFHFKVPMIKGKVQCPIYDQKRGCIDIQKINPDCEIVVVIHIRGLKFLKHHYYCDAYISQMKVYIPRAQKYMISDKCLIEDDDEMDETLDESAIAELEFQKKRETEIKSLRLNLSDKMIAYEALGTEIKTLQERLDELVNYNL